MHVCNRNSVFGGIVSITLAAQYIQEMEQTHRACVKCEGYHESSVTTIIIHTCKLMYMYMHNYSAMYLNISTLTA